MYFYHHQNKFTEHVAGETSTGEKTAPAVGGWKMTQQPLHAPCTPLRRQVCFKPVTAQLHNIWHRVNEPRHENLNSHVTKPSKTLHQRHKTPLTQVLYLGDDAGRRVIGRPVPVMCLRDKFPDGAHVVGLAHEGRCHKIHIVLYPVARDTDLKKMRQILKRHTEINGFAHRMSRSEVRIVQTQQTFRNSFPTGGCLQLTYEFGVVFQNLSDPK